MGIPELGELLPHAYPIEIVQLASAMIGMPSSLVGTLDAIKDLRVFVVLRRRAKLGKVAWTPELEDCYFVSRRNFREELIRLIVHVLFIGNGVISVWFAPPDPGQDTSVERYVQLTINRSIMTTVSILLTLKSLSDNHDRLTLRAREQARRLAKSLINGPRHKAVGG